MAWTNPPPARATGDLILATDWNTLVHDNPNFLKGRAGVIVLEDAVRSDTDITDDLGTTSIRWRAAYIRSVYANRFRASRELRDLDLVWEDSDNPPAGQQVLYTQSGVGGTANRGGSGQVVLKVDNDNIGDSRIDQRTELNSAKDNAWTVTKSPYFRAEFSLDVNDSRSRVFIGFRATPGGAIPAGAEIHAGLIWNGTNWFGSNSAGVSASVTANQTVAAGSRHVIEVWNESATAAEYWIDGVLAGRVTGNLPTGALEWSVLLDVPAGGGAADDSLLTVGKIQVQEVVP